MADESQRNRRGAADTAAKAVKWGLRARWLLGCGGCGCFSLLSTMFFAILISVGVLAGTGWLADLCTAASLGSSFLGWWGLAITGLLLAICP